MTKREALDRAAACEKAVVEASRRAVALKERIDAAVHVLRSVTMEGTESHKVAVWRAQDALALLTGKEGEP